MPFDSKGFPLFSDKVKLFGWERRKANSIHLFRKTLKLLSENYRGFIIYFADVKLSLLIKISLWKNRKVCETKTN